ncbi:alpha/beta hydrolase [Cryobacterium sp. TMT2-15-1]|nr:alpha/beta hydrolase [Cryobacterium sp. TMT2-15-1]
MHRISPGELHRFNAEPLDAVDYHFDLDYVGDGIRDHRLDVLVPHEAPGPLPVYVYFHGGGWTSGDKAPLTKYAASQAVDGMIVVNANYRMATRFQLKHMLDDGNEVLRWVARNIEEFGGDPHRIVLGGDSAGGHIAVDTLIYDRKQTNTRHTWQQDGAHPESQEVYRRLGAFVRRVSGCRSRPSQPSPRWGRRETFGHRTSAHRV